MTPLLWADESVSRVDSGVVTAVATVAIALINMIGSVLLTWIRASYKVPPSNGSNISAQQPGQAGHS